jgi:ATP-grasp domain
MTAPPRLAVFCDQTSISILPFFATAREHCRIVWVVGWSPNTPPLRMLSRFGEVVDLTGLQDDEVVEHLVRLQPDGVLVFNDAPIRLAAAVADRLGLPFHSPHSARLLTDKMAQRAALRNAGLAVPAFAAIRPGEAATGVPFPAVLKPRAGAGSRDTFKVTSAEQVAAALVQCDQNEEFILEEWLPDLNGDHGLSSDLVSVESVARNGAIEHIMVSGRFPFAPPFRETGTIMPSDFTRADKEAVTALAGLAIEAMEVRHGLLHTEVKMTPDGPRIIEINGRLGGRINELMERIDGPSMYAWAVRLAVGEDIGPVPVLPESPVAFFRWIVAPEFAAAVESIEGLDQVRALAGVTEVLVSRPPGSAVDAREGSPMGHVMKISGLVASHRELLALDQKIESSLQLTWRSHDGASVPPGVEPA